MSGWQARRRATAGYTLIEVMMAIGIITIGAVGLMSLQRASIRANSEARQMSFAHAITETWVDRLKRDALAWNQTGAAGLAGTRFLQATPVAGQIGQWFTPVSGDGTDRYSFNAQGEESDGSAAQGPIMYCTHVRLRWVVPNTSLRADVRTFYHRRATTGDAGHSDARMFQDCGLGAEANVTTELDGGNGAPRLRAVYGSALLRWSSLQ